MLGAQVAVPLAHPAAVGACLERRCACRDEGVHEALELLHPTDLAALPHVRQQLVRVAQAAPLDLRRRRLGAVRRRSSGVKARERDAGRRHLLVLQLAALQPPGQRLALVVSAHLDDVVERPRILHGRQIRRPVDDRDAADAAIDVGRQPAIEPHLGLAHRPSALGCPVVDEIQRERLLELVHVLAGQEHPRDVRLANLDPRWVMCIALGTAERLAHLGARRLTVGRRFLTCGRANCAYPR